MTESAATPRDRRRIETTRALTRVARRRTAAAGLASFTVEEMCEEVGISRRTFFNYFASKDDAVIGIPLFAGEDEASAAFIAAGPAADTAGPGADAGAPLSPTLFTDLCTLSASRWAAMESSPGTRVDMVAAVEREPRLLARFLELVAQNERHDIALVEQREHLASGDLRAAAAVQIVDAISRAAFAEFLQPDVDVAFTDIVARRADAAIALFTTQSPFRNGTA